MHLKSIHMAEIQAKRPSVKLGNIWTWFCFIVRRFTEPLLIRASRKRDRSELLQVRTWADLHRESRRSTGLLNLYNRGAMAVTSVGYLSGNTSLIEHD
jgi:hypothetical protein